MIGAILRTVSPLGWMTILAAVLAALFAGQSVRLKAAQDGRAKAEAALVNPETGRKWSEDARALEKALRAQNAAVEALQREGEVKIAQSREAASRARAEAASAQQAAAALLARKPQGATVCERAIDQQRAFLEALK